MIIREAKKEDIDSIVVLLQASLGESLLKKSGEIWNFKHVINPFGESTVLLAEEDSELIGVRAFMTWRWQIGNQLWNAYRAVDTATHPNHQGKGIFKKLTLQALDEIQQKGDCFVFNTPNNQSRPGYLKMGWQEVGKINVALTCSLFYFYKLFFFKKYNQNLATYSEVNALCNFHNEVLKSQNVIFTPKSAVYLKWRYEDNLLQDYKIISTQDFYIAMYVKKHRFYNELRVVEIIGLLDKENKSKVQASIVNFAFKNSCWLITLTDKKLFKFIFFGAFGPILTFKAQTSNTFFIKKALRMKNWNYSIGDLELF